MHPKLLAYLVHRFDATDRFKCYLGLELATKNLALCFAHHLLLLQQATILIYCLKTGTFYNIRFEDEPSIEEALFIWKESDTDFADCLIGAKNRRM